MYVCKYISSRKNNNKHQLQVKSATQAAQRQISKQTLPKQNSVLKHNAKAAVKSVSKRYT